MGEVGAVRAAAAGEHGNARVCVCDALCALTRKSQRGLRPPSWWADLSTRAPRRTSTYGCCVPMLHAHTRAHTQTNAQDHKEGARRTRTRAHAHAHAHTQGSRAGNSQLDVAQVLRLNDVHSELHGPKGGRGGQKTAVSRSFSRASVRVSGVRISV